MQTRDDGSCPTSRLMSWKSPWLLAKTRSPEGRIGLPRRLRAICLSAMLVFGYAGVMAAQQPASGQEHPDAPSAAKAKSTQSTYSDIFSVMTRRSIFFPDIAASEGALSPSQKFKLFLGNSIAPSTVLWSGMGAAFSQATNSPEGWGQGWDAYGKRFGASMARNASSEFFGTFLLASALHEDPRFFPQTNPTFWGSVKYSLVRVVTTRSDTGEKTTNWNGLLGPLMAEGLANAYWPDQDRTVGQTFERYGFDLANRAGGNMLRNYWPVFFKRLRGSNSHPNASHN